MSKLSFLRDDMVLELAREIAGQGECMGPGMQDPPCGTDCDCIKLAEEQLGIDHRGLDYP